MLVLLILLSILLFLFVVLSIAFVTLLERHLLGGSQLRKGPGKVSFYGLFQAFFDGIKLLNKELLLGQRFSLFFFYFVPCISFVLMLMYWMVIPYFYDFISFEYSIIFMMCLVGFFVYSVMLSGVMSKSKYGLLGGLRASSQSVSYEVIFSVFLLCLMFQLGCYTFVFCFNFFSLLFIVIYLVLVLAELNRAPFDFSEGESELVSGFNVEYSSVPFVLLFLSEYGNLLFFSLLFSVIFFNFSIFVCYLMIFVMIFVRSSFPRFRYDKMMGLFWFSIMPVVLILLFFSVFYWLF